MYLLRRFLTLLLRGIQFFIVLDQYGFINSCFFLYLLYCISTFLLHGFAFLLGLDHLFPARKLLLHLFIEKVASHYLSKRVQFVFEINADQLFPMFSLQFKLARIMSHPLESSFDALLLPRFGGSYNVVQGRFKFCVHDLIFSHHVDRLEMEQLLSIEGELGEEMWQPYLFSSSICLFLSN